MASTCTDDILTKMCALRIFSTRKKALKVKFEKGVYIFSFKRQKEKREREVKGESERGRK